MQICFATNNANKLREVKDLLGGSFTLITPKDLGYVQDLPEEGETFEANSKQKANFIFNNYRVPCFADDSGLVVAALNGAPGVYSARYAGEQKSDAENLALLLKNMQGIHDRNAQFETVITLVEPGNTQQFKGIIQGSIATRAAGIGGFGYDPVFVPQGNVRTFAEMTPDEKNAISHRSIAIRKLISYLLKRTKGLNYE